MSDAAGFGDMVVSARLLVAMDEQECKRRNALAKSKPGFALRPGQVGNVLETFAAGEAYLVEFGPRTNGCDWLGVLYRSELEIDGRGAAAVKAA